MSYLLYSSHAFQHDLNCLDSIILEQYLNLVEYTKTEVKVMGAKYDFQELQNEVLILGKYHVEVHHDFLKKMIMAWDN